MIRKATDKSRGIRLGNFVQIRHHRRGNRTNLDGQEDAKEALDANRDRAATSNWPVSQSANRQFYRPVMGPDSQHSGFPPP